jgi:hypothetical protein
MGKGVMAPDYVLGGFEIKVGLRISWGNEGRVWRHGRQGGLWDALFGAAKDGAENGNEELTTLVGEGIAKWAVFTVGWDRLQADRTRRKGWMQGRLMSLVRREKTLKSSYDWNASENIARVNATSTFHFNHADRGVVFAI